MLFPDFTRKILKCPYTQSPELSIIIKWVGLYHEMNVHEYAYALQYCIDVCICSQSLQYVYIQPLQVMSYCTE